MSLLRKLLWWRRPLSEAADDLLYLLGQPIWTLEKDEWGRDDSLLVYYDLAVWPVDLRLPGDFKPLFRVKVDDCFVGFTPREHRVLYRAAQRAIEAVAAKKRAERQRAADVERKLAEVATRDKVRQAATEVSQGL